MAGREWTEEEDRIVCKIYPPEGAKGTRHALLTAGFERSIGSVYSRANILGLLRNWHWTDVEDAVIIAVYPVGGRRLASEKLAELGYERSIRSVCNRARALGIQRQELWRKHSSQEERDYKALFQSLRTGAYSRDIDWQLSFDDFVALIKDRRCYYCGAEPTKRRGANDSHFYSHSLDRVNNDKGYVISNVVPCCKWCNFAKAERTIEEFKEWVADCYQVLCEDPR